MEKSPVVSDTHPPQFKLLLNANDINLVMFHINEQGPDVLFTNILPCIDQSNHMQFLKKLATYSMIAITQGNEYMEGVHLLPIGSEKNQVLLVISFMLEKEETSIHENYYQVGIILSKVKYRTLPNILTLETQLMYLTRIIFCSENDLVRENLGEFKRNLLHILNTSTKTHV